MSTTTRDDYGLAPATRLSKERAEKLILEQRRQMAADNDKRRAQEANPTFRSVWKLKGLLSAIRWSLGIQS